MEYIVTVDCCRALLFHTEYQIDPIVYIRRDIVTLECL